MGAGQAHIRKEKVPAEEQSSTLQNLAFLFVFLSACVCDPKVQEIVHKSVYNTVSTSISTKATSMEQLSAGNQVIRNIVINPAWALIRKKILLSVPFKDYCPPGSFPGAFNVMNVKRRPSFC